jgi:hypothetical protein
VTAAASFVIAASAAYLPDNLSDTLKQNIDFLYVIGSGGLGLSLFLIHIYVTEIKRTLQALWGLGVLGSAATYFYLAQPANKTLIQYVVDNPSAVWLVGPLFAALTGLVFKEGDVKIKTMYFFISAFNINWKEKKKLSISCLDIILYSLNRTVLWQARSWSSHVYYSYTSSWPSGNLLVFLQNALLNILRI